MRRLGVCPGSFVRLACRPTEMGQARTPEIQGLGTAEAYSRQMAVRRRHGRIERRSGMGLRETPPVGNRLPHRLPAQEICQQVPADVYGEAELHPVEHHVCRPLGGGAFLLRTLHNHHRGRGVLGERAGTIP